MHRTPDARGAALTQIIADRYEVMRPLAQGGMGSVYVAIQQPLGREVALKVIKGSALDAVAVRRFAREARLLASLRHRHIVTVYDFGESEDGPYLAMELLEGPTLRQRLKRQGPLGERATLELLHAVATGLSVAHEAGITHRDLKPSNILFAKEGDGEVVKLLDFGLAIQQVKDHSLTESSAIVGTPGYIAPERALHGVETDPRGDLYALGVIAFEALAGESPYKASTAVALVMAHASEPVPTVRDCRPDLQVSAGVERLVHQLMAKRPEGRPPSAAAVAARCQTLLSQIGSGAPAIVGLNPSMVTERSSLDPDSARSTTVHGRAPAVADDEGLSADALAAAYRMRNRVIAVAVVLAVAITAGVATLAIGALRGDGLAPPLVTTVLERERPIFDVALDTEGKVAAYTEAGALHVIELGSGATRKVDEGPLYQNAALAFVDDDHVAVARAPNFKEGQPLVIVSLSSGERETFAPRVAGVAVDRRSGRVAWGTSEGVFVSDRRVDKLQGILRQPFARPLGFALDGKSVLVADHRNAALLEVAVTGRHAVTELRRGDRLRLSTGELVAAWAAPDTLVFAEQHGTWSATTRLFKMQRGGTPTLVHQFDEQTISGASFAAGRWLISASRLRNDVATAALDARPIVPVPVNLATTSALPIGFVDEDRLIAWSAQSGAPQRGFLVDLKRQRVDPLPRGGRVWTVHRGRAVIVRQTDDPTENTLWSWTPGHDAPDPILSGTEQVRMPNGTRLSCALLAPDRCLAAEDGQRYTRLYLVDPADGWSMTPILQTLEERSRAALGPRGERIAINVAEGFRVVDLASGEARLVTPRGVKGDWVHVAWGPDGQSLIGTVLGLDGRGNGVVRTDLDGNAEVLWRHDDQVVFEPVVSPGGTRVAFRLKRYSSDLVLLDFSAGRR